MMFPVLGVVVPGLSEYAASFGLIGEKRRSDDEKLKGCSLLLRELLHLLGRQLPTLPVAGGPSMD
jgi:hypothetical protein